MQVMKIKLLSQAFDNMNNLIKNFLGLICVFVLLFGEQSEFTLCRRSSAVCVWGGGVLRAQGLLSPVAVPA